MPGEGSYISEEQLRAARERAARQGAQAAREAAEAQEVTPRSQDTEEPPSPAAETPAAEPATDETTARPIAAPDSTVTSAPRKKRRIGWKLLGLLFVALLLWMGAEHLNLGGGDEPGGMATPTAGGNDQVKPDQQSIKAAVQFETMTIAGPVKRGCALAVDPHSCNQGRISGPVGKFLAKPKVLDTAALAAEGSNDQGVNPAPGAGKRTVVLVTFTIDTTPTPQKWAVLVRDSDHKVIGIESIGSEESGMTLAQVGAQIQEDNR